MEVRSKYDLLINYLINFDEVEGIILNKTTSDYVVTVVCSNVKNNYIINDLPVVINDSKCYDLNKPNYYLDKLMNGEILFDKNSRLGNIKSSVLDESKLVLGR